MSSPELPTALPVGETDDVATDEGTDDVLLSDALPAPVTVSAPHHNQQQQQQQSGRVSFDKSGASAKLKNASMTGGGGNAKPIAVVGDRPRTASGVGARQPQPQSQQQQQSVKAREMKSASLSAKESSDSTR